MKPYNNSLIPRARQLRKDMTPWERKLWYTFLNKYPIRFQRQKVIGNYIVDFYCAKARLILELDGSGHYEQEQEFYDGVRTSELERLGLTVIRIPNTDIMRNFREVCEMIDLSVKEKTPSTAERSPFPKGEGKSMASLEREAVERERD